MLILSRRESECIHLGDDIVLTIVRVSGEKVRIGVDAPAHVKILRNELDLSQSKEDKTASEKATTVQELVIAEGTMDTSESPAIQVTNFAAPESTLKATAPAQASVPIKVRKVPIQVKRSA